MYLFVNYWEPGLYQEIKRCKTFQILKVKIAKDPKLELPA